MSMKTLVFQKLKNTYPYSPLSISPNELEILLALKFLDFEKELGHLPFTKRDLLRQIYLHLYRFNSQNVSMVLLNNEIQRIAEKLFQIREEVPYEFRKPANVRFNLKNTQLRLVDNATAHIIHEAHHYLGSPRNDGLHLGLYTNEVNQRNEKLLSIATLSPFDLIHISDLLPTEIHPEQVMVLSRLFAFDWCPKNTISFSLGRLFAWVREKLPNVKMLITYLNPNLGFNGTVYSSSNWTLFGLERKERYLYLNGNYVTDRQMINLHGTAKYEKLHTIIGDEISKSIHPMQPLKVYSYYLDEFLKKKYSKQPVYDFTPNTKLV